MRYSTTILSGESTPMLSLVIDNAMSNGNRCAKIGIHTVKIEETGFFSANISGETVTGFIMKTCYAVFEMKDYGQCICPEIAKTFDSSLDAKTWFAQNLLAKKWAKEHLLVYENTIEYMDDTETRKLKIEKIKKKKMNE